MQKQLYLLSLFILYSYSTITHTTQSNIMFMSNSSNDKNKCYITAKHYNVLIGTVTASLEGESCLYNIEITPGYENTGIAGSLIRAMVIELKTKNPTIDFGSLKIRKITEKSA